MPIGETIFLNVILQEAPKQTPDIPPRDIISGGSTNLKHLAPNTVMLHALHSLYSLAISRTFISATTTAAVALTLAVLMDWRTQRKRPVDGVSETGSMHTILVEPEGAEDTKTSSGRIGRNA